MALPTPARTPIVHSLRPKRLTGSNRALQMRAGEKRIKIAFVDSRATLAHRILAQRVHRIQPLPKEESMKATPPRPRSLSPVNPPLDRRRVTPVPEGSPEFSQSRWRPVLARFRR